MTFPLLLVLVAAASPAPLQINSPSLGEVGGNVTMNFGNVVLPNNQPASVVVNAKLDRQELATLGREVAARLYTRLEAEHRAVIRGEGEDRKLEIPDLELLRGPLLEMTAALEKLTQAVAQLNARLEHADEAQRAFLAEIVRLRERLELTEANARMERERWRSERSEAIGPMLMASGPQGTVRRLMGLTMTFAADAWRIAAASHWGRAVSLYAGVSLGYASLWREGQIVGLPRPASDRGQVRDDLALAGLRAGLASRWESWRADVTSEVGTRPFTGWGLRWTLGASLARRIAAGRWWLRVAADAAPIDSGASVDDLALAPLGQSQVVATHLPLPWLQLGVGAVAIFP